MGVAEVPFRAQFRVAQRALLGLDALVTILARFGDFRFDIEGDECSQIAQTDYALVCHTSTTSSERNEGKKRVLSHEMVVCGFEEL